MASTDQASGSGIQSNTWYRNSKEEAKVAKLIYAQNEAWEKAEGTLRPSEIVEQEQSPTQEKLSGKRPVVVGEYPAPGNKHRRKEQPGANEAVGQFRQQSKESRTGSEKGGQRKEEGGGPDRETGCEGGAGDPRQRTAEGQAKEGAYILSWVPTDRVS